MTLFDSASELNKAAATIIHTRKAKERAESCVHKLQHCVHVQSVPA
jgi:hypothetical protein